MGENYSDNDFTGKDIISIHDFSRENIEYLVEKAQLMKKAEKNKGRYFPEEDGLPNKKLALLFYENSTRTRTSFEQAMIELRGLTFGFSGPEGTSLMKKENIFATSMMYWAYHADAAVMRHKKDGSVQWAADILDIPVFNGGDGINEHPTQSLLDMVSIDELHPGINNVVIGMGGDLKYGRTVRSLSLALSLFNNIKIYWAADDKLAMPEDLIQILKDRNVKVERTDTLEEAMNNSQIFYMTRPQIERIGGIEEEEIHSIMKQHQVTVDKITSNVKILHPLPVNKEIAEIDFAVFYHKAEYFFSQAENGLFLRKALELEVMKKQKSYIEYNPKINRKIVRANNKILHPIKNNIDGKKYFVDKIENGIVIDHIDVYKGGNIQNELKFKERGFQSALVENDNSTSYRKKDLIKIKRATLTDRDIKQISLISPKATFNIIKDGNIIEKFNYQLCSNDNCITHEVTEDVPPRFDNNNCHYCRHEYIKPK